MIFVGILFTNYALYMNFCHFPSLNYTIRLKTYGYRPVMGDLLIKNHKLNDEENIQQNEAKKAIETLDFDQETSSDSTIFDVVLPLLSTFRHQNDQKICD